MVWLFAAVVLVLMVFHQGFRRIALYFVGLASILGAVIMATMLFHENEAPTTVASAAAVETPCEISAEKSIDPRTAFFACGTENEK